MKIRPLKQILKSINFYVGILFLLIGINMLLKTDFNNINLNNFLDLLDFLISKIGFILAGILFIISGVFIKK